MDTTTILMNKYVHVMGLPGQYLLCINMFLKNRINFSTELKFAIKL